MDKMGFDKFGVRLRCGTCHCNLPTVHDCMCSDPGQDKRIIDLEAIHKSDIEQRDYVEKKNAALTKELEKAEEIGRWKGRGEVWREVWTMVFKDERESVSRRARGCERHVTKLRLEAK